LKDMPTRRPLARYRESKKRRPKMGRRFGKGGRLASDCGTRIPQKSKANRPTPRPRRCGGPEHHGVSKMLVGDAYLFISIT